MMRMAAVAMLGLGVMAAQAEAASVALAVSHGKVSVVVKDKERGKFDCRKAQQDMRKKSDKHQKKDRRFAQKKQGKKRNERVAIRGKRKH